MPSPERSPVAGELWLAAHDTVNGKPRLAAAPLATGLAAALLTELIFAGCIKTDQDSLYLADTRPPADPALAPIVIKLCEEEERSTRRTTWSSPQSTGHDMREWIKYLKADNRAFDLVTRRLLQSGEVRAQERRTMLGLGRATTELIPADANVSGVPASRITIALQRRERLDIESLVLAGLFLVTGLHQQVFESLDPDDRRVLRDQLKELHPMPRYVLRAAEQVVGEAVMTR